MTGLEGKIGFMLSKFRDLILKAAIDIIKKRHKCPLGDSMELSARFIEKEPSRIESVNLGSAKASDGRAEYKLKKAQEITGSAYSSSVSSAEVQVSCCCGQSFLLNNKDKEFQIQLKSVETTGQKQGYEMKQQKSAEYNMSGKGDYKR